MDRKGRRGEDLEWKARPDGGGEAPQKAFPGESAEKAVKQGRISPIEILLLPGNNRRVEKLRGKIRFDIGGRHHVQ